MMRKGRVLKKERNEDSLNPINKVAEVGLRNREIERKEVRKKIWGSTWCESKKGYTHKRKKEK